jgi:hypoxanthine-DNA glycosylase
MKAPALRCLAPVADGRSRVLILGSFPGPMSLAKREYYAYPRNQFWKIVFGLLGLPAPVSYGKRISALADNGIALWDVIASCRRAGAADGDIADPVFNDVPALVRRYPGIGAVFCNGGKAFSVASAKFGDTGVPVVRLPSTSPANAGHSYAYKMRMWRKVGKELQKRRKAEV